MADEQWKTYGYCSKCLRQKYCKTECTRHKRRVSNETIDFIRKKLDERSGGAYSMIMNQSQFLK